MADEGQTPVAEPQAAARTSDGAAEEEACESQTTTEPALESPAPKDPKQTAAALVAAYDEWVLANTGLARNVETMLYVAPQLVPKRVLDPEVATQCGYSLVGLLNLYHDYVLYKSTGSIEQPTTAQRLTRLIRVPLSLISHVQVLAEVVARKTGGDVGKWRLIVYLEVVKGMLRLLLLAQQRRAMIARGGKYKGIESSPRPSPFARFKKSKPKQPGSRTGKTFGKATAAPEPTPAPEEDAVKGANKITFGDGTFTVDSSAREDLLLGGEVCHVLRPVVYALLRQRRSETSWTPAVVSLLVELSGLAMSAAAVKPAAAKTPVTDDKAKAEISARKMALLLYLLRDPVFASVTKPATAKAANVLDHVPGVGKVFRFGVTAILDYYHQFHFYTSAS